MAKNRLIVTCFLYYPVLFLLSPGLSDRANWEEAPPYIWFRCHGRVLQPTHGVPQFPGKPPFLLFTGLILHIVSVEGCLKAQRCSVLQPKYTHRTPSCHAFMLYISLCVYVMQLLHFPESICRCLLLKGKKTITHFPNIFAAQDWAVTYILVLVTTLSSLLLQDSVSWMPYLSYICILAVIASFCSGPGKTIDLHNQLRFSLCSSLSVLISLSAPLTWNCTWKETEWPDFGIHICSNSCWITAWPNSGPLEHQLLGSQLKVLSYISILNRSHTVHI